MQFIILEAIQSDSYATQLACISDM